MHDGAQWFNCVRRNAAGYFSRERAWHDNWVSVLQVLVSRYTIEWTLQQTHADDVGMLSTVANGGAVPGWMDITSEGYLIHGPNSVIIWSHHIRHT